ncbi:MAG: YdcF family protein, partial [Candidatus Saccharibacteria bacterium]|nr:YdcF family protein [Rhodoferax sp.]
QAIVVLTGGNGRNKEAARLHLKTGLPVLASGGDGEAAAIKKHLVNDFHLPVRWTEEDSLNTEQNALFTAKILAQENIQTIILVTHALHMRRARKMFEGWGLEVIPAPTDFSSFAPLKWDDFLPSTEGRKLTKSALHEIFGLAWYRIRQIIR